MRETGTPKAKRIAAGLLGLVLLFAVLFSAFYLAAEADHHCCGEHCRICACIRQCEVFLRRLGAGAGALSRAVLPVLALLAAAAPAVTAALRGTPVSGKVRSNR